MYRSVVFALSLSATTLAIVVPQAGRIHSQFSKKQTTTPVGASTANIPRPQVGNVPYGVVLTTCSSPKTIALTFDDGPSTYTNDLLNLLDQEGVKATFFITGLNLIEGGVDNCASIGPGLVSRAYASGHQIAHHTWTHLSLNGLSDADFGVQMYNNEMALRNILGKFPTYMRPPYLDCDGGCQSRLGNLGYHIISTNLDTLDWENDDPNLIQNSKNIFGNAINGGINGPLVLEHDIHYQTVYSFAAYAIATAKAAGYSFATVGQCLNDPPENWYRDGGATTCGNTASNPVATSSASTSTTGSASSTSTASASLQQTTDGQCGANGRMCGNSPSGPCCSQYNWCGTTSEHCGVGCQSMFGACN